MTVAIPNDNTAPNLKDFGRNFSEVFERFGSNFLLTEKNIFMVKWAKKETKFIFCI